MVQRRFTELASVDLPPLALERSLSTNWLDDQKSIQNGLGKRNRFCALPTANRWKVHKPHVDLHWRFCCKLTDRIWSGYTIRGRKSEEPTAFFPYLASVLLAVEGGNSKHPLVQASISLVWGSSHVGIPTQGDTEKFGKHVFPSTMSLDGLTIAFTIIFGIGLAQNFAELNNQ